MSNLIVMAEAGADAAAESVLPGLLDNVGTVVAKFSTLIADVFDSAIDNPVCIISLGITVAFAAIAGVRKLVKSLKGVR